MEKESHPAFTGESKAPQAGDGFETTKESRRKKRRERRNDRARQHERAHAALEPLTIWVRTDPNRLQHPERETETKHEQEKAPEPEKQPERKAEVKPQKPEAKTDVKPPKIEKAPEKVEQPKPIEEEERKIPAPEAPNPKAPPKSEAAPEPMNNMPVFQELPRLDIRPRHFYTEPEVRQPNTTETEHDILPAATMAGETPAQPESEEKPSEQPATPAEKLQELAQQAAKRAQELQEKNQLTVEKELEPEAEKEPALPKPLEKQPARAEMNEHVRAIAGNKYEKTDIRMDLSELLDVAESIRLEGVSVAEMFRAERIDDEGLRRIITEFLRGERIEKSISEEILRQQLKYERDPQMRQVPLTAMQDTQAQHAQAQRPSRVRRGSRTQSMRHQADRIADRLAGGIDRAVEATENNPNAAKTIGGVLAVIVYFVILILIIRS